ncbi:beta-ketoacyl synthase N-terminal-like domain-containing protein [Leeuwenhoekiella aequorea]|uniref:3-oxoacyl-(Acyl-carrier-protein) synthase n=1 Tax=Leeuwenhoekiella aequorea TaxID=283736 RepID=A0A4Q0P8J4_9FLAO|nr:beta-ketoacyl synthase N-terminal-like domain-containing protein [Leeuwenhoekiella aequorea]RXG22089.1 3-oxoacyl-(acyl-carrier-protein) synthase [Leeuwenhoekiella aequorea]
MKQVIAITGISAISATGADTSLLGNKGDHNLSFDSSLHAWVGKLPADVLQLIEEIREENRNYLALDASVLYAIYVSRKAIASAGWDFSNDFGINIGSSRGATQLFEKYYSAFLENGKSETLASPTTTLGNISSWVAQDLQNEGPDISHSITCSTALHSLLNGVAWLQSGMCDKFMVGGSEAALTPFTIAQMRAMKTYSRAENDSLYPCLALDLDKAENTMVLGEGAASVCLEIGIKPTALAYVVGVGYATEKLKHAVSISAEATCFQKSMKMAIEDAKTSFQGSDFEKRLNEIDAVVMHAPGTQLGDTSEYMAIQKIFKDKLPLLTTNKWKIGHTFGASGLLSLDLAIKMLQSQEYEEVPFISPQVKPKRINNILVNAVGFGGNAVSILLRKA